MERHAISALHSGLLGATCQSGQQGQWSRNRWCTISQEWSQLRRIFVLDTENLCSISISEEMGPGEACVVSHLSWVAVPEAPALVHSITPPAFDVKPLHFLPFRTNPILKYSVAFRVVDFYLKWSWLFYFVTLMEVRGGRGEARGGGKGGVGCWGICNSYFPPAWLH